MDAAEVIFRAVRDGVVDTSDAGRTLEAFKRALAPPRRRPVADDPERPYVGWTLSRCHRYAIAAAASGAVAELPKRPVRASSGRGLERMPSPKQRMKPGGKG